MNPPARDAILLVSDNPAWLEGMGMVLESVGVVQFGSAGEAAPARALEVAPTAALVDTTHDLLRGDRFDDIAEIARGLRRARAELPIVLLTNTPRDDLSDLAIDLGGARVLMPEHNANAKKLASELLAAFTTCPSTVVSDQASYATIELTVSKGSVHCDVRADGAIRFIGPRSFNSLQLLLSLNKRWKYYESDDEVFRNTVSLFEMNLAGQDLRAALQGALDKARDLCPKSLARGGPIYYRFNLADGDGDLEFIPFEAVATGNDNEYLRDVHPLARRLVAREEHVDPDRAADGKARRRVLLILSKAEGLLSVPPYRFKERDSLALRPLAHLDRERSEIEALYQEQPTHIEVLELGAGMDGISMIERAFETDHFDVVHFAGHSARAHGGGDTSRVFLALPAPADSNLVVAYAAEDLARLASEGQTRLVILSSCESSSGQTLSHMASRGVPAVAGFRWPVDDQDAHLFTIELHRELLAQGGRVAVAVAFHKALQKVKSRTRGRLSAFWPILLMQRSAWHDFHLEA